MAGMHITSSVISTAALKLAPIGTPAKSEGVCGVCGLHIKQGDLSEPFRVGAQFMDDLSLAARGEPEMCGHCVALMKVDGLVASGYGVFSGEGARPFRKWVEIATSIMEPPEPPFVMLYATAKQQHMAWRAPVNFSRDLFRVRVGLRDLQIRRQRLLDAVEACQILGTAPGVARTTSGTDRKTLPNPFVMLSSDLTEIDHGRLTPKLKRQEFSSVAGPRERKAIECIQSLTLGETWALRFVLTPNAGQSQPTPTL